MCVYLVYIFLFVNFKDGRTAAQEALKQLVRPLQVPCKGALPPPEAPSPGRPAGAGHKSSRCYRHFPLHRRGRSLGATSRSLCLYRHESHSYTHHRQLTTALLARASPGRRQSGGGEPMPCKQPTRNGLRSHSALSSCQRNHRE